MSVIKHFLTVIRKKLILEEFSDEDVSVVDELSTIIDKYYEDEPCHNFYVGQIIDVLEQ